MLRSSIGDEPRKMDQGDLFSLSVYQDALIYFVQLTDTPFAISLQGSSGSGRTSLMTAMRHHLCAKEDDPYFGVWLSAWQFALLKDSSQTQIGILQGIVNQLASLTKANSSQVARCRALISSVFAVNQNEPQLATTANVEALKNKEPESAHNKAAASAAIPDADLKAVELNWSQAHDHHQPIADDEPINLDNVPNWDAEVAAVENGANSAAINPDREKERAATLQVPVNDQGTIAVDGSEVHGDITQLRAELSALVEEILSYNPQKRGLLFFLDDFDLLSSELAVDLLVLLKNLVALPHCVLMVAINYDTVVRGLVKKWGLSTDHALPERYFRSFFDRLVQLSFKMPRYSAGIRDFIAHMANEIGIFSEEELMDNEMAQKLYATLEVCVAATTDHNVRKIKNLLNAMSLILITNEMQYATEQVNLNAWDKVLLAAVVGLQFNCPALFNLMANHPDFLHWDEEFAAKEYLPQLNAKTREVLSRQINGELNGWKEVVARVALSHNLPVGQSCHLLSLLDTLARTLVEHYRFGAAEVLGPLFAMAQLTHVKGAALQDMPLSSL